ncbi:MAG: ATP-binding protein [Pseudomonadota bacterium]
MVGKNSVLSRRDMLASSAPALAAADSGPAETFDSLTRLATQIFRAPMGMVSLLDGDRQWFRSHIGLDETSIPREGSFCHHAALEGAGVFEVCDTLRDPRFATYAYVVGAPHVRYYAGALLRSSEGEPLGTLCVADTSPRPPMDDTARAQLRILASAVESAIQLGHELRVRREADARIAEQARTLEIAEQAASLGHWRLDRDSGVSHWSDGVFDIHGLPRAAAPPSFEDALALYHPDDQRLIQEMVARAWRTGIGFDTPLRLQRASDGAERWVRTRAQADADAKGRPSALLGVIQDITEERRALTELRASEARYRLLADNCHDILLRIDRDGVVRYASPSCRQLGYAPEDVAGRHLTEFLPGQHRRDAANALLDLFNATHTGSAKTRDYPVVAADGSIVWLEGASTIVRDINGEAVEMVSVFRDVTARRELEARLQAAAEAKTVFLANMSHELRTPLTSILGFSSLLATIPELPTPAAQHVGRITAAGQALLALINDVLDFSKLEAGQIQLEPAPADVPRLLEEVRDILSVQAAVKGIDLTLDAQMAEPRRLLDDLRLRQVLVNLTGNAIKFTDHGSVTLRVRETGGAEAPALRVEVIDTGPGIPQDRQERLFKRFSQVDGSVTRRHGGSGLGLSISRELVELMGGRIGVESQEGQGAVFWLEAPAPVVNETNAKDSAAAAPASASAALRGRILIVDDHPMNRELVRLFLASPGLEIDEAEDGQQALAFATAQRYDLVLMDVNMPVLDGLAATSAIRATCPLNVGAPIVALTAQTGPEIEQKCFDAGMDAVLAKPIQPHDLIALASHAMAPADVAGAA